MPEGVTEPLISIVGVGMGENGPVRSPLFWKTSPPREPSPFLFEVMEVPMRNALILAMLPLAALLACSQASETRIPEVAVFVKTQGQATKELLPDGIIEFSGVAESKTIEVRNSGYATLRVDEIRLEGDNPQFTLDLRGVTFPKTLEPAEGAVVERIEFDIAFTPGGGSAGATRTLVIVSNDPLHKEFRAIVTPKSLAPNIVVNTGPGPVDATTPIGQPWPMEFRVTNTGTDALVITAPLALQDPDDDEFSIFKTLDVGVPIYPAGSGFGAEEATFTIRYLPKDAEPDENHILITSNDPDTPVYSIHIRGFVTGQADIRVSYPDQAVGFGCVDFSQVVEEGETCTKVVTVQVIGGGQVSVKKPTVTPAGGPYAVQWYQAGGSQVDDGTGCGAYQGTPLGDEPAVLNAMRPSLDVAVTYTAPGAKGVNGTLTIEYTTASSVPGQKEVQLCGGVAKGEIDVAPPMGYSLMFFAPEGETRRKTVVVANKGNGPLTIRKVEVAKDYPATDPEAFTVTNPPQADFQIPAWGLLPLVIEFGTDYEQPKVSANLVITYRDPLTDSDTTASVRMEGRKDFEGITLPTADPGAPGDYAGAKAGQPLTLDGSGSQGGTYALASTGNNGYRWFLIAKPAGSRLFLNVADTGPKVPVTPDVAGDYTFGLVVYAGDTTTGYFFSDEATLTVSVGP